MPDEAIVAVVVGIYLAVAALLLRVCYLKGRLGWGLLGLVIPFILLGSAIKIARPDSTWARVHYRGVQEEFSREAYPYRGSRAPVNQPETRSKRVGGRDPYEPRR